MQRELPNSVTGCKQIEHGDLPDISGAKNGAQPVHLLTQMPWGATVKEFFTVQITGSRA